MPLNGIVSTLPDKEYIAELEKQITQLQREVEQLKSLVANNSRAR